AVLAPIAACCRTGTRADASSRKSRTDMAPPRGRRKTLQRRSRAPLLPPAVDLAGLRPQDRFGERIDRDVAREVAIEHRSEHERAGSFERQLVDLQRNLQAPAERKRA